MNLFQKAKNISNIDSLIHIGGHKGEEIEEYKSLNLKNVIYVEPIKKFAKEIENKIWKIWTTHPSTDRRGYRLTELLAQGDFLMTQKKFPHLEERPCLELSQKNPFLVLQISQITKLMK